MAENVIRQDIIQLDFQTDLGALDDLKKGLDDIKKAVKGAGDADGLDKVKKQADKAKKSTDGLGQSTEKTKRSVKDLAKVTFTKLTAGLKNVANKLTTIGKKAAGAAYRGLKKIAGISFKALITGLGAAAGAVATLVSKSVSAYAEREQLLGGVETLLGTRGAKNVQEYAKLTGKSVKSVKKEYESLVESQKTAIKNANNAYKTAGLSANDYMTTVTSFSASLAQSFKNDMTKTVKYADVAVSDMADNANKMGTDMGLIQNAYQGFAKQNYTMLDNLKLGYGGTKGEMQRLVKDAAKLDKSVDASSLSFGNIVKAIHAVQVKMDIYGTTQKEAEHTISGSLYSLKAAWGNLLPALIAGGDEFDQCVKNMKDSAVIFFKNIKPAIITALSGVGDLIEELMPIIEEEFPKLVDELLPPLLKAATSLVKALIIALPDIVKIIVKELPDIAKQLAEAFGEAFNIKVPSFDKFFNFFAKNANKIVKAVPLLLGLVAAIKLLKGISAVAGIFGKSDGKGGLFTGILNTFQELGKTKTGVIVKGMANLAIIIGGLTLITALLLKVAPKMAQLSDAGSFLKVVAFIGILGLIGAGMAKLADIVGKIPITTVVKGLANMAIMIAGLSALLLVVGAVALLDFDYKNMLKVSGLLVILGVVGTALSVFAGIAGIIPIPLVLKGIANIALAVAGMSALFVLIGAVALINFDYKRMLCVVGMLGVLGLVGTALTVFAAIAGIIPIPVVLAGLANIALVIGGLTALIVAFGALSQVKGFNEFITKGGETLANLFKQIGKIAGALIGGFGEGISESLPKIGANLTKFVTSLKPIFSMFKGVDMSGAGTFFSALGTFMLKMAGNDLISIFTGGTDLAALGTELTNFAKNSAGFFSTVAEFPENGFPNATKLFNCLAGMKNLPKEGGMVSWFKGNLNYANIAAGLGQLSSANVVNFFTAVAKLEEAGFTNATKLFDCLAGLKSLPKEGGVVGWFSGKVNYENIATGLGKLSAQGVQNFFKMVSALSPDTFSKTSSLFKALASIDKLPTDGVFARVGKAIGDKVTGTKAKSALATIADDLSNFAEKAGTFFSQVNSLNLDSLNGLWNSLKNAETVTEGVSKIVDENISDMVKKVSDLPKQMADGVKKSGSSLSSAFAQVWTDAVKACISPINKLISGANWIFKQFGSNKTVAAWTPYAKGTNGHKGGNALVNDGNGAELVQMPNGNTFIPKGRNVLIPNAPKGMKVLPADRTAQLMGKRSSTFRYADGVGEIDPWEYMDNPKGLINRVAKKFVNYKGMQGLGLSVGKAMVSSVTGEMPAWAKKLYDEMGVVNYNPSKGVEQWRSTVIRALKMENQYSEANIKRTLHQMQTESGGNPKAINLWDSNAKKGTPSKGLMQVIDPTFRAYARKGFNKNIYDPLSNILASIRYAVSRYGTLAKAYRGVGYANGGIATKPSIFGEDGKEMAIPLSQDKRKRGLSLWSQTGSMLGVKLPSYSPDERGTGQSTTVTENNNYSPVFNLTISGTSDDRTTARKVKRWVQESIEETFDSMNRRSPKLREV